MANQTDQKGSSIFPSILNSVKNLIFTEEYVNGNGEDTIANEKNSSEMTVNKTTAPVTNTQSDPADQKAIMDKIYELLQKINKPGIDFLELWNAAEAMGGVNQTNLQNAFKALQIGSGNTLSIPGLVDSGMFYKTELEMQVNESIKKQNEQKEELKNKQGTEKNELLSSKSILEKEISDLTVKLNLVNKDLSEIDEKYVSKINQLEQKVALGKSQLEKVINTMLGIIDLVKKIN